MAETDYQIQINDINRKLDLLLEYIGEQRQKRQVVDDLIEDVTRVGTEIFKTSVKELDERGIEIDPDEAKNLIFTLLSNIKTFNMLLSTLQNVTDFVKDAAPIAREMIIDVTHELHRLHENGTIDAVKSIARNVTNPKLLQSIARITQVLNETGIDEKLDNKSLFKLYKELKSPEVRKGLSYTLRVVKAISSNNNNN